MCILAQGSEQFAVGVSQESDMAQETERACKMNLSFKQNLNKITIINYFIHTRSLRGQYGKQQMRKDQKCMLLFRENAGMLQFKSI